MSEIPEAGWYSDPSNPSAYRWWDGKGWTEETVLLPADDSEPLINEDPWIDGTEPLIDSNGYSHGPVEIHPLNYEETRNSGAAVEQESPLYEKMPKPQVQYSPASSKPFAYVTEPASPALEQGSFVIVDESIGAPHGESAPKWMRASDGGRRLRIPSIILLGLLAVVVLAGSAVAAFVFMSGRGPQPEEAMPATTIAFVKIDLNPPAGQKVNFVRFLRNVMPKDLDTQEALSSDDPLGSMLDKSKMFEGSGFTWKDIAPWVGDRIAIAVIPGPDGTPVPAVYVAVRDEAAMNQFFDSNKVKASALMVRDGYAVIAEDADTAKFLAGTKNFLSESPSYKVDRDSLGTGQMMAAWADAGKLAAAEASTMDSALPSPVASTGESVSGRYMFGVTFDSNAINVDMVMNDFTYKGKEVKLPSGSTNDIASLPKTTILAASVANLGSVLESIVNVEPDTLKNSVGDSVPLSRLVNAMSSTMTFYMVEDDAGFGENPLLGVRIVETDKATYQDWVDIVSLANLPSAVTVSQGIGPDGTKYIYLTSPDQPDSAQEITNPTDGATLSGDSDYKNAISGEGSYVMYLSVGRLRGYLKHLNPDTDYSAWDSLSSASLRFSDNPDRSGSGSMHFTLVFSGE